MPGGPGGDDTLSIQFQLGYWPCYLLFVLHPNEGSMTT